MICSSVQSLPRNEALPHVRVELPVHPFIPIASCAISGYHRAEPGSCSDSSLQPFTDTDEVPSQSSLLRAEQPQHPQLFLVRKMLQSLHHLCNLHWTHFRSSMSISSCEAQSWTQHSRCASLGLNRGAGSPPSTCWQCSSQCTPGSHWPPWPQGHCWLRDSLFSTRTPKSFSAELLFSR